MDFFKILCIQVTFVLQFVFHQHLKTIECHNPNKMKLVRPKKGVCLLAYFRVTVKMLCFLASSLTQSVRSCSGASPIFHVALLFASIATMHALPEKRRKISKRLGLAWRETCNTQQGLS